MLTPLLSDKLPVNPPVEPRHVLSLLYLRPVQAHRGVGRAVHHQAQVPQGVQGPEEHVLHLGVTLGVAGYVVQLTGAIQGAEM